MEEGMLTSLGGALLGGLILNVMPCVLPVLTMKVFHLIEHSTATRHEKRLHGLAYTGGILATFLAFALVVIGVRASGESLGWGMQFQSPAFVAGMCALIYAFGLNALGVFDFTISLGGGATASHGYGASFANGVVASIMSTPCSAPFLGTAAAFALGSGASWWETLAMFSAIGVGLASPFLLVSFVPEVGRVLPRPGAWMETFKKLMGFSLIATSVWLFGVLQSQVSRDASTMFLFFLVAVGFALWTLDHFGGLEHSVTRRLTVRGIAAAAVLAVGLFTVDLQPLSTSREGFSASDPGAPLVMDGKINWRPFDRAQVSAEARRNRPIFVDFTADWCVNCKANEKAFIETQPIRDLLVEVDILPMKADMTNEDDVLQEELEKLGRSGIPAYVILMPDGSRDLLPEVITTRLLVERLEAAAKRFPRADRRPDQAAAPTSARAKTATSAG